jgi:dynein heavy chain
MYPDDFEKFLQKKCLQQRELLEKNWIPKCAKVLINLKKYWEQLVPKDEEASLQPPMRFYNCVATLMSNQLRNLVVDSLAEFVSFFEQYQVKLELIYVNFELFSILCFNLKGRKQI